MQKIIVIILILLVWLLIVGFYHSTKKPPPNTDFRGADRKISVENIEFLYDLTYKDKKGDIVSEQAIFDEIFSLIDGAESYILIDAFLFNAFSRDPDTIYRPLVAEFTEKLVKKKQAVPAIRIDFITDPINTVYGGDSSEELEKLRGSGVNVIVTDLKALPDSNPIYSAVWRTFVQWFGNSSRYGLVPHPFTDGKPKVTLRSYFDMINFKANHRKIFMADRQENIALIITSGNPHDGSSAHSNVALKITGNLWRDVYTAEEAVAEFTGRKLQGPPGSPGEDTTPGAEPADIVFLTENQIKKELLARIRETAADDEICMALFYLSDRHIIKALLEASGRGVRVRIVLDPNRDAFGFEKNGVPNRPAAAELTRRSSNKIQVRWYDTHGEQFHSKMTLIKRGQRASLILGSANLTRRNLNNFNLEANLSITTNKSALFISKASNYFDMVWENRDEKHYTVDYEAYMDTSVFKRMMYLAQEYSGMTSF